VLLLGNIVGCYAIVILCSFTHNFITVTQKDEIRKRVTSFQNFAVPLRRKGKQWFWYCIFICTLYCMCSTTVL